MLQRVNEPRASIGDRSIDVACDPYDLPTGPHVQLREDLGFQRHAGFSGSVQPQS